MNVFNHLLIWSLKSGNPRHQGLKGKNDPFGKSLQTLHSMQTICRGNGTINVNKWGLHLQYKKILHNELITEYAYRKYSFHDSNF